MQYSSAAVRVSDEDEELYGKTKTDVLITYHSPWSCTGAAKAILGAGMRVSTLPASDASSSSSCSEKHEMRT